ncbi:hypothetical protein BASA81_003284 [Batrachochytrium salamandrivorans]|nr:hypothetical protein BASA81_003284 [Batrachochytrium salamandrivorans]
MRALTLTFPPPVHCEENVVFWIAVEYFRAEHCATPRSSDAMRKRLSTTLKIGETFECTGAFQGAQQTDSANTLHSRMLRSYDALALMDMPETQLQLLNDAVRICKTFLEQESPHWVSLEDRTANEIRNKIAAGDVDVNLFAKAQAVAYDSLKRDLFPRFVAAVNNDPHTYSSNDTLDLPGISVTMLAD